MARKFKTPITIDELGSASSQALAANVDGDSQNRINIDAGGKITWGSGSATGDTTLYRSAADTLKTDDAFTATSLAVTGQFTLPTSDGSADQIITTNGSGTLTWSDVSANATVSDTAPSSPATGQIWYESDTGKTFVYYDSFWVEVGASPPASPFITDLDEDTKIQVEESSDEDKIRFDTAGSERMIIDSSGNVGIGTTSPDVPLHINIGTENQGVLVESTDATARLNLRDGSTSGNTYVGIGAIGDDLSLYANNARRLTIQGGNVGIGTTTPGATLDVNGSLSKVSGSFKIPHPLPAMAETHNLVHSFVEAPQADNLYRGRVVLVDGAATVDLDEAAGMTTGTFELLNRDLQCFIVNNEGWTAVSGVVSGSTLTITAQDAACVDTVDWLVIGERHDQHMYDTEWTDDDGRVIVEPENLEAN